MSCENYMKFKLNKVLCTAYGCFHAVKAELSSCNRDCMRPAEPKIFTPFSPSQKMFADF